MGYVLIVSLPMVVFFILLSFGCYALGRHKGQQEGRAMFAQSQTVVADGVHMAAGGGGIPPPPVSPHYQHPPAAFPPPPHHPNPIYPKQQNGINVA
ncbi:hypothetical protein COLO4_30916 [Corchorus olitorius]|uniref:Uncharacterized protein n=1 Tax=Corchorus olitorius TaxID=93759 RepID=A0A1R3H6F0_9ROSI|nr:hypothetical protein COLO4_30916 [Corchorus olitorius]